jgi:EmrB/QacA subfamily drug resistance transporter
MTRNRWLGLFFLSLGVSLIIVDATIVNVAVPSLIADLKINSSQAQWIQETYTLVFAALLLVFGRLADVFGRRRMFQLGALIFLIASAAAAFAGDGNLLIAARTIQGIGGAMMLPTSLSLLNATFTGRERGIAFAVWGSTIGGTAALGPLLGGWLTTNFSWRWAFGINIPLGLMVIIGAWIYVAESRGEEAEGRPDFIGAVLSVVSIGSIVFGLIEGRVYGWWMPIGNTELLGYIWTGISPIPVFFAFGAVTMALFIAYELRRNRAGKIALLDLSLFALSSFRNGNFAAAIVSLGEFGLLFALPLWLQNSLGHNAFETGAILLALAIGSFFASGMASPLTNKYGAISVVRFGIAFEIIGVAAIGFLVTRTSNDLVIIPALFAYGIGVGLATAQLTGVVLADVPVERGGQASGTASTVRQLGSALGIAVLGSVLFTTLGSEMTTNLKAYNAPDSYIGPVVEVTVNSAGANLQAWSHDTKTAAAGSAGRQALGTAAQRSAYVGAGFLLLGLLASLRLKNEVTSRDSLSEDTHDQHKPRKSGKAKRQPKPRSQR